jgi:isopropylmalate/homocitrate/citramalate synthase
MKKSDLIKIIKEELENTLSELGTPPVMALRTGAATAAGTAAAAEKAELAKRKAHNDKLIAALRGMPADKVHIEIEAKDVMLRPKHKLRDLRDALEEITRGNLRAKFAGVYPSRAPKHLRNGVIVINSPVSPHLLADALKIAFTNLGLYSY